ncbi:hypothetical protein MmiEs2_01130 [Methanimicrococcus stummii]|uniref:Nucleotidyl transferase AbiEii/AbiGii toxin family protein n=1 Tax=Methanimicrococcus stummii TaxID=3028294 RepID=A0AA96ZWM0_9EURY|nr:nucleotidyl transferase AbiEii/AbiGii toxin family protein [Methanimicrococcus sp. Es2]WNY27934.1 hypothetical protein MmiEs2_01130 [Methanimicrococcus sp. Es2]
MKDIAISSEENRRELFQATANRMGIQPAIVEKDFWVCWILDYLFHRSLLKNHLVFKGGTSLSKCYNLIERFSEDVDLILDWRVLGYETSELMEKRTLKQQNKLNHKIQNESCLFLKKFLPKLEKDLKKELGSNIHCDIDSSNEAVIRFSYPRNFSEVSILPAIRLEINALAVRTPSENIKISPYAADFFPNLFSEKTTEIQTVTCERTFWEKITILHREAHRLKEKQFPERYSRHYYDVYCIANSAFKKKMMNQIGLLEEITAFKEKFYPNSWAQYNDAKPGTLKLMPPEYNLEKLKDDYEKMKNMFFYPDEISFDEIMKVIEDLEIEINNIK